MKMEREDIKDETCSCGCLKSDHKPSVEQLRHIIRAPVDVLKSLAGHGACTRCDCQKFTWTGFVV